MLNAKNSSNFTKKSKILIALTAILTLLYFLSFTKSCSSKDRREKVKTSLVNQKYSSSISSFELQDASGSLILKNKGSFWTVSSSNGTSTPTLPVSPERIQNLIQNLTIIRNLYKISDNITQNSSFGLTNGTEFHLRYNTQDSFHELIFGNQDFSLSSRYMMTEKSTQVYEIDNSLDNFLTTSIQSWAEPYIISQVVLGKITPQDIQRIQVINHEEKHLGKISDTQKLLELRHGGAPDSFLIENVSSKSGDSIDSGKLSSDNLQITITLELGNKNEIEVQIFKSKKENEFTVMTSYKMQKDAKPFYSSASKISSWTYNKIREITL